MAVKRILVLLLLIILMFRGLLLVNSDSGQKEVFHDTYTKALCSGTTCRDFEIKCLGDEFLEMKPISGFVTFGDDWVDLREEKELC